MAANQTPEHSPRTIAIVGIAAQLPSGEWSTEDLTYATFWDFLLDKGQACENISSAKLEPNPFRDSSMKSSLPERGAFLKQLESFDNISFGVSSKDAQVMSFNARRLMELSFLAMQDSGIDFKGRDIGCFMCGDDGLENQDALNAEGSFAYLPSAVANRISHTLNITGPSVVLDTACSSSLTALHLAINSIHQGDCTAAIVGACQSNRRLSDWINYHQGGVLSPDGLSKPFDATANGFARGEGAVVIVIKKTEDAIRDHDHIYAEILASAINTTGSRVPPSSPSGVTHQQCILTAYRKAGLSPAEADYVELHATGTSVGDPVEANAAREVFAGSHDIMVGSVKGNIGHLEAAAFLASLVKACLIIEHGVIPPAVNLTDLNPNILWDNDLHVPTEATPLGCRSPSGRYIISLSSSGIGGSTGHVILRAPSPSRDRRHPRIFSTTDTPVLCIVGGLFPNTTQQISQAIISRHEHSDATSIFDTTVTLCRLTRQFPWRTYFTLPLGSPAVPSPRIVPSVPPPLAFVFSGQGPQHIHMGRHLFAQFPAFRDGILEMDQVYQNVTGISLLQHTGLFLADASKTNLDSHWPVTVTSTALAMVQIALFDLFASVGIRPDYIVGHSAGETAAVYASGAGSKAMAMEIAIARGQAMVCTENLGGMAALACSSEQALAIISEVKANEDGVLDIACLNAPESVTVSGSSHLLDMAVRLARSKGFFAKAIRTLVPGHSALMDVCKDEYCARIKDVFARYAGPHTPLIPVFSTCSDHILVEEFTPDYFWKNVRNPVQFSRAISSLLGTSWSSTPVFVELSPHPVLSLSILSHLQDASSSSVVCPMGRLSMQDLESHPYHEMTCLLTALGELSMLGINQLDLSAIYGPSKSRDPTLDYPLVNRSMLPRRSYLPSSQSNGINGPLSTSLPTMDISVRHTLSHHVINDEPILPMSGFIEILLEAGAETLWDVNVNSVLSLSGDAPINLQLERDGVSWSLSSRRDVSGLPDSVLSDPKIQRREHARGCMDALAMDMPRTPLPFQQIRQRLEPINANTFYDELKPAANFGQHFRRVVQCHLSPQEALAEIRGLSPTEEMDGYIIHPAMLDACLHSILHPTMSQERNKAAYWIPSSIGCFQLYKRERPSGSWFSHVYLRDWTPERRSYDITIADSSGILICAIYDLQVRRQTSIVPPRQIGGYNLIFQPVTLRGSPISLPTQFVRPDKHDAQRLYAILDFLAYQMISESLAEDLVVGDEVHRRRYYELLRNALVTRNPNTLQDRNIMDMQIRWPAYFEITDRVRQVHKSMFASSRVAVDVLYADGLMSRFYSGSNLHKTICEEAAKSFSGMVSSAREDGKRSLRVLEVGAGTGLLTKYLLDQLRQQRDVVAEYTVTDVSPVFVADLAHNSQYDFVIPRTYDLSKSAVEQGFTACSYDFIVALHALHVVPDLSFSLSHLYSLLGPGGCLLVVDLDGTSWTEKPGSLWHDCIFGSFAEWSSYMDGRTHCSMEPAEWRTVLEKTGFTDIHTSIEGGGGIDFLFSAQKPSSPDAPVVNGLSSVDQEEFFVPYCFGQEVELQAVLASLDPHRKTTLHLITMHGPDADAALGLVSTLAREFESWSVRLSIFESGAGFENHAKWISRHAAVFGRGDNIVLFPASGSPHVPRVVPLPSLSTEADTSRGAPGSSIAASTSPAARDQYLTVKVIARSAALASFEGFVGDIIESKHSSAHVGQFVAGLAIVSRDSVIVVHAGCVTVVDDPSASPFLAGHVIGLILGSVSLGPSRLAFPEYSNSPLRVLIAVEDQALTETLRYYFEGLPSKLVHASLDPYPNDSTRRFDVIITDSSTLEQFPFLRHRLPANGKLIHWDLVLGKYIEEDVWLIRYALEAGLKLCPRISTIERDIIILKDATQNVIIPDIPGPSLFDFSKAYILLGGIGGLGIDLAIWMYQNGARNLILTSRSGLSSRVLGLDSITSKKLKYLNDRSDLTLRMESCDATDIRATASLINTIEIPLGGCFLMTLALSDGLFVNQSLGDFRVVRESKIQSLEAFATVIDIESLDFFIAFSSVAGLLGMIGQANYASVCTALNGALTKYSNAFSLIVPGILDSGYLAREMSDRVDVNGLKQWSISPEALWECVETGLRMLRNDGKTFSQLIPFLPWDIIDSYTKLPNSCRHLIPRNNHLSPRPDAPPDEGGHVELLDFVLGVLSISMDDFSPEVPLTTYGLDSIGAAKLAAGLRPHISVSQMQLLGGVTWAQLVDRGTVAAFHVTDESSQPDEDTRVLDTAAV